MSLTGINQDCKDAITMTLFYGSNAIQGNNTIDETIEQMQIGANTLTNLAECDKDNKMDCLKKAGVLKLFLKIYPRPSSTNHEIQNCKRKFPDAKKKIISAFSITKLGEKHYAEFCQINLKIIEHVYQIASIFHDKTDGRSSLTYSPLSKSKLALELIVSSHETRLAFIRDLIEYQSITFILANGDIDFANEIGGRNLSDYQYYTTREFHSTNRAGFIYPRRLDYLFQTLPNFLNHRIVDNPCLNLALDKVDRSVEIESIYLKYLTLFSSTLEEKNAIENVIREFRARFPDSKLGEILNQGLEDLTQVTFKHSELRLLCTNTLEKIEAASPLITKYKIRPLPINFEMTNELNLNEEQINSWIVLITIFHNIFSDSENIPSLPYTDEVETDIVKTIDLLPSNLECPLGISKPLTNLTPLHYACLSYIQGRIPLCIVEYLLAKGANPNTLYRSANDSRGNALTLISKDYIEHTEENQERRVGLRNLLLQYGANES